MVIKFYEMDPWGQGLFLDFLCHGFNKDLRSVLSCQNGGGNIKFKNYFNNNLTRQNIKKKLTIAPMITLNS